MKACALAFISHTASRLPTTNLSHLIRTDIQKRPVKFRRTESHSARKMDKTVPCSRMEVVLLVSGRQSVAGAVGVAMTTFTSGGSLLSARATFVGCVLPRINCQSVSVSALSRSVFLCSSVSLSVCPCLCLSLFRGSRAWSGVSERALAEVSEHLEETSITRKKHTASMRCNLRIQTGKEPTASRYRETDCCTFADATTDVNRPIAPRPTRNRQAMHR